MTKQSDSFIDPNTIDWKKFEKKFPFLNKVNDGEPNVTDYCPVCGEAVDHLVSLLHINSHGKDPVYGIEYGKALEALVYLQLTIRQQDS
jgi:hypothetical protein